MLTYTLLAGFAVMLASLSGKLLTYGALGRFLMPRTRYLVALSAGVFAVIVYGLVEELLHEGLGLPVLLGFVLGIGLLELVTRLIPHAHHHHGKEESHSHSPLDARRLLISDAVHNVHDGAALVPAFLISPVVGFGTAAAIFLHELVQELSEFFVLKEAGYSTRRALTLNFLVASTLLIGILMSALVASVEELVHPLVAFATGGFTYVLLRDLLPSVVRSARSERAWSSYASMFLVGVVLMSAVTLIVPHEEHGEETDKELPLPEGFELG